MVTPSLALRVALTVCFPLLVQVITAVAFQGERLGPFPPSVLANPGGAAAQELVDACTREDPAERVKFPEIVTRLEAIWEMVRPLESAASGEALFPGASCAGGNGTGVAPTGATMLQLAPPRTLTPPGTDT